MYSFCKAGNVEPDCKENMAYYNSLEFGNIGVGDYFGEKALFINPFLGK